MPVVESNLSVLGTITGTGATVKNVTQSSHGFSVGNVLKFNGTTYALAKADTTADAEVVGIVAVVINTNNFSLLQEGYISGLSSLTAGTTYFLSPSSAGALTATAPTTVGQVNVPLLVADTTTSGYFHKYRGEVVSGAPSTASANTVYAGPTTGSPATPGFRALVSADMPSNVPLKDGTNVMTGFNNFTVTDANTNTYATPIQLAHDLSSGTAAAGFGVRIPVKLQSTTTIDQLASSELIAWVDATDATRKARRYFYVSDTSEREAIRIEASGTAAAVGFLGANAVVQQTGDVGTAVVTFGLMSGTPTFAAANLTDSTGRLNPPGMVIDYASSSVPTGWLACDGSAVSRTTFAALFSAIGVVWGAGNGTTTFNVPDLRGRTSIGSGTGSGLSARTIATTGGEETHQLTTGELASHTHQNFATGDILAARNTAGSNATFPSGGLLAVSLPQNSGSAGSNTAHNNMQPFAVLNKIIKT